MKPQLNKLAVLMSAAGLGFGLSSASALGQPIHAAHACLSRDSGAVPCQPSSGELLLAAPAEAVALPLHLVTPFAQGQIKEPVRAAADDDVAGSALQAGTRHLAGPMPPSTTRVVVKRAHRIGATQTIARPPHEAPRRREDQGSMPAVDGDDQKLDLAGSALALLPDPAHALIGSTQTHRNELPEVGYGPYRAAWRAEVQRASQTAERADHTAESDALATLLETDPTNRQHTPQGAAASSRLTSTKWRQGIAVKPLPVLEQPFEPADGSVDVSSQVDSGLRVADAPLAAESIDRIVPASPMRQLAAASAGSSTPPVQPRVEVAAEAVAGSLVQPGQPFEEHRAALASASNGLPGRADEARARSAGSVQVRAPAPQAESDTSSFDRVLLSLAEVLGEQSDTASSQADAMAGAAAVDQVVVAAPAQETLSPVAVDTARTNPAHASATPEIVVVSNVDKVLLSLAALQAGDDSNEGRFGAQTKEVVVVRQIDKVLLNLASFQPEKAKKRNGSARQSMLDRRPSVLTEPAGSPAMEPALGLLAPFDQAHELHALGLGATTSCRASSLERLEPELPVAGEPRAPDVSNPIQAHAVALSADKLSEVRGGFLTKDLTISFGIERAVYLNGDLVTTTSLNVVDLGKMSAGQAQAAAAGVAGSLALIQSGPGNSFSPGMISPATVGTVIQNTLDNQKIQTTTRIDAVVNSAEIMKSINLHSSMRSAVIDSLRK